MWDLRNLKLMRQVNWAPSGDVKDLSSIYSVSLVKPSMDTILACGTKCNSAKLISVATGEVVCDFNETHPDLDDHPLTIVDTSPLGRIAIMATSNGQVHCKNILVSGTTMGYDSDDSPMMTPKPKT